MADDSTTIERPLGTLGFLMERSRSEGLGLGIAVAAIVHAAVFAATWPTFSRATVETIRGELIPIPIIRFTPPPPVAEREPVRAPARRVPIPDPTPFDPEPIRHREPVSTDVVTSPDAVFGEVEIPDPPPAAVRNEVIRVGGPVSPPRVIHRVLPGYTEAARRGHIEGAVVLDTVIDTGGVVQDITVLRGLPFGLTESAVEAVRQWRFEPSVLNGRTVAVRYVLTVRFRLE